jgi:hypothetical protein
MMLELNSDGFVDRLSFGLIRDSEGIGEGREREKE